MGCTGEKVTSCLGSPGLWNYNPPFKKIGKISSIYWDSKELCYKCILESKLCICAVNTLFILLIHPQGGKKKDMVTRWFFFSFR